MQLYYNVDCIQFVQILRFTQDDNEAKRVILNKVKNLYASPVNDIMIE